MNETVLYAIQLYMFVFFKFDENVRFNFLSHLMLLMGFV